MAVASSQQSFLTNALITPHIYIFNRRKAITTAYSAVTVSCRQSQDKRNDFSSDRKSENELAKLAVVTLAAGVLTLGSIGDASAAKSGGRVGGQAFRSAPRSAPKIYNNSRTNIYVNPPVAPPLVGGYGYGYGVPFYGGGWGWSPFSFFAPGPSVAVGIGGGFETFAFFLFLGAAAALVRKFINGANSGDDDDY